MYVDILILTSLQAQPRHGYEIKRLVQAIIGNSVTINNNQLYPALRHFEELGAIMREVAHSAGKPDRHVYHMTERGEEILQDLLHEFTPAQANDEVEFQVYVAFFHLLDHATRLAILATRTAVLVERQIHLERSLALARDRANYQKFAQRIIAFNQQNVQHELDWISTLQQEIELDD